MKKKGRRKDNAEAQRTLRNTEKMWKVLKVGCGRLR
jgi:hypothetical protein